MVDQPGRSVAPRIVEAERGDTGRSRRARRLAEALWRRANANKGRPLPPIRPWPRRQWPLLVVLAGVFVSLVVVIVVDFRPGTMLFAVSVLLAAAFRLVLTTRRAGLLVLRSRTIDVVTLTVMGVAALLLALAIPDIR